MTKSLFGMILKGACPLLVVGVTSFAAVMVNTGSAIPDEEVAPAVATETDAPAFDLADLRVAMTAAGTVDGVTLRDSNGTPMSGLTVSFVLDSGIVSSLTDALGEFVISGVTPGNYSVTVTGPGVSETFEVSVLDHSQSGVVPIAFDPSAAPTPPVLTLTVQEEPPPAPPEENMQEEEDDEEPLPPIVGGGGGPVAAGGGGFPLTIPELGLGAGIGYGVYALSKDGKSSPARP